jgi:hypothetical protein
MRPTEALFGAYKKSVFEKILEGTAGNRLKKNNVKQEFIFFFATD